MKYLNGRYYRQVEDHRYEIHRTENVTFREREEPKSLEPQYQLKNTSQIRTNQKVIKNESDDLIVKSYPEKKQPIQEQPPDCPSCKRNFWLEVDKG